jgi:hypothetical protein
MSFQAYLDNIKAKTGKTPDDFAKLASQKGLAKHGEIVAWLKTEFALGHGHANAIAAVLLKSDTRKDSSEKKLDKLLSGKKDVWRAACREIIARANQLGPDVVVSVNETYVNLVRGQKKFAILQPSSAERFDVGIKLKGISPAGRFEAAGSWNSMVTHRVRIRERKELDAEFFSWLRQAYDVAASWDFSASATADRTHAASERRKPLTETRQSDETSLPTWFSTVLMFDVLLRMGRLRCDGGSVSWL